MQTKLKPLARVIAFEDGATDPIDFPIAPAVAIPKVCYLFSFNYKSVIFVKIIL